MLNVFINFLDACNSRMSYPCVCRPFIRRYAAFVLVVLALLVVVECDIYISMHYISVHVLCVHVFSFRLKNVPYLISK